ncbi:MAG: matrixin family metalloprotease [Persicimonas sp.]
MNKHTSLKTLFSGLIIACGLLFAASNATAYVFIHSSQCPNGAAWGSGDQPLDYYINQDGSNDVGFSQVESIMQDSFDEWSAPCCSSFDTTYQGTTTDTALQNNGRVVLSFEEQSWPTQMGNVNQTIAVTLSSAYSNCELAEGPILFNGVGFTFCTSGSGCTDLQAIATHEMGHNLGLGHSSEQDATMYASYTGGTSARTLAQDDIDGVCALYRTSCNCSSDADCGSNEICDTSSGQCEEAPCQSDADCATGQECGSDGECAVPTCNDDSDCAEGFDCDGGKCLSDCEVCRDCTSQSDCGSNGFCADLGSGNKCITNCGENGGCPGDSQCFGVPAPATSGSCTSSADCATGDECYQTESGNFCATPCTSDSGCDSDQTCQDYGQVQICADTHHLCLNPDADTSGVCPDGYVCDGSDTDDGGSGDGGSCDGLGNSCANDGADCTADNDVCLGLQDGSTICSCQCTSDADCGSDGDCVEVEGGSSACVPGTTSDPCDGVTCGSGEVCEDGQCVDDGSGDGGDDNDDDDTDDDTDDNEDTGTEADAGGGTGGGDGTGGGSGGDDAGSTTSTPQNRSEDSACAVAAPTGTAPGSLMLLGVFGLGFVWRRRRRK